MLIVLLHHYIWIVQTDHFVTTNDLMGLFGRHLCDIILGNIYPENIFVY